MTTLMVWDYQMDYVEGDYVWKKIPTEFSAGSHEELLFWRVMNSSDGSNMKEYFYSPEDYEAFSGNPMCDYQERAESWREQYESTMNKLNIDVEPIFKSEYTGRSYASLLTTELGETNQSIAS